MANQGGAANAPGLNQAASQGRRGQSEEGHQAPRFGNRFEGPSAHMSNHRVPLGLAGWAAFHRMVIGLDQVEQHGEFRPTIDKGHRIALAPQALDCAVD